MTKFRIILGPVLVGLLTLALACGDADSDAGAEKADNGRSPAASRSQTPEPNTHTFVDVYGKVREVPTNPQRIVAIHDFNGGAQLLSLEAGSPANGGYLGEISDERIREFDADLMYVDAYWEE